MRTHRLSSAAERVSAVIVSVVLALLMGPLLYAFHGEPLALVLTGLAALLVTAVLVFYLVSLFRAACGADTQNKRLTIRGVPNESVDLTQAVSVKTVPCGTGPISTRSLVFSDSKGDPIATVPTFFTSRQGAQAEPLAAALALELGLDFQASLEPWEYDRKQRAEHEKEAAQARATARKARLRALKAKILPGTAPEPSVSASPGEASTSLNEETDLESDGINYDALDDEK